MRIIEILPKLELGGVETHVSDLASELARRGHSLLVISGGGRMTSALPSCVEHLTLPVFKKNPITAYSCSLKVAALAKSGNYDVIHAHSRVPAWIAFKAARRAKLPYVLTAHSDYSNKSKWIYLPYRRADRVIAVSESVKIAMKECFSERVEVVENGLDEPKAEWKGVSEGTVKFLYVGRISEYKGLESLFRALPEGGDWTLDLLGDGSFEDRLRAIAAERGIDGRITFHGYSDRVDEFMAKSSCLLFPSPAEGYGLVAARAAQIGLPALMSDIPPISKLAGGSEGLLPPGDTEAWCRAIEDFMRTREVKASIPAANIRTLSSMADSVEKIYSDVIKRRRASGSGYDGR